MAGSRQVKDRGQLLDAAVWSAFGLVVFVAAWRVDRLENLGINPWSIPGLLPGLVGVLMMIFAALLALRPPAVAEPATVSVAGGHDPAAQGAATGVGEERGAAPPEGAGGMLRAAAAAIPCVLFATVGPGTGWPFAVDAALYVALFIALFSWPRWRAEGRVGRSLLATLVIAAVSAGLISWLFESVFLVRLP